MIAALLKSPMRVQVAAAVVTAGLSQPVKEHD